MAKNIEDIIKQANQDIEELLADEYFECRATDLGLDNRGARTIYVKSDGIVISLSDQASAEYYQGLQYVGREFVLTVGDFVLYKAGSARIDTIIDRVLSEQYDDEDDDME